MKTKTNTRAGHNPWIDTGPWRPRPTPAPAPTPGSTNP